MCRSLVSSLALLLAGCGSELVLVPPGQPVRIIAPAQVHAAYWDGTQWVGDHVVTIPAGWYGAPPKTPTTRP